MIKINKTLIFFIIFLPAFLTSCKENFLIEKEPISVTLQLGSNFYTETKLKCGNSWENSQIYEPFAEQFMYPTELISDPMSQLFFDVNYIEKSISQHCNFKNEE